MVEVREEPLDSLGEHARISIAFTVTSVVDVSTLEPGARAFREVLLAEPYPRDYDAEEGPASWPARFDVSRWGLIAAYEDGRRVGGVVIAHDTSGVDMLEGRSDLAMIWDLRVEPDARGRGIGTALLEAVESWARARGCTTLKVETQQINVAACRLYARAGFELRVVDPLGYPELPGEAMLLWYKDLTG